MLVLSCCILLAYVVASVYAAEENRGLYADGSYYLVRIAETQNFLLFDPARTTIQVIRQLPLVILQRWTDLNLAQLGQAFSLSMLLIPVLLCALCWPILPPGRKPWIFFPILNLLAGVSASRFAPVGEGAIAASYFWPLLLLLLFRTKETGSQVLFLCLLLPAFYLHEAAILLMPVLALICALRFRQESAPRLRIFLALSATIAILITAYELRWILLPQFPEERAAYLSSLFRFVFLISDGRPNLPLVTGILALVALAAVATMNLGASGKAATWPRTAALVFAAYALIAIALAWYSDFGFTPNAQLHARNQAVFVSAVLAILATVSTYRQVSAATWMNGPTLIIVATLSAAQIVWDIAATNRWRSYVDDLKARLANSVGLIYYEQSFYTGDAAKDINWRLMTAGYAMPTLSIALNTGGPIASLVTAPKNTAWQAFDPSKPDQLPKIRGVDYVPYAEAITRTARDQHIKF